MLLKLPNLRQPVRQLRYLAGSLHNRILRTYFHTFPALGTVKVIDHVRIEKAKEYRQGALKSISVANK